MTNSHYPTEVRVLFFVSRADLRGREEVVPMVGADAVINNRVQELVQTLLASGDWFIESEIQVHVKPGGVAACKSTKSKA
ncbi:hypothetical protein DPMN_032641 [Dreissena polymorpha]|uniref:Uncharacterized protein n=1 Tax=Dreissena polymorpha TaxID=45954 RepID=A0A9D4M5F3_DREPO|nr:hypothetical protein DPMN_032641 [Dreissena polymorpha]